MDYAPLGKTGLTVSVLGVGTGGPSRVGLRSGGGESSAVDVIRAAIAEGVNLIDTAQAYGTEEIVRRAIDGEPRERIVLSTKISHWEDLDADGVIAAVDERLRLLGTDYIDICHFHAVTAEAYPMLVDRQLPGLIRAREAGKVRFIGITERGHADPGHAMLSKAVHDPYWDVVMVLFNMINQSARERVLSTTMERRIGVLAMFAVRVALSRHARLVEVIAELIRGGQLDEGFLRECGGSREDPLGWVTRESDATTLVEAAYRLVRHEPGIDVTLSGTGSLEHLRANIASAQMPPLDPGVASKLHRLFARVDSASAQ